MRPRRRTERAVPRRSRHNPPRSASIRGLVPDLRVPNERRRGAQQGQERGNLELENRGVRRLGRRGAVAFELPVRCRQEQNAERWLWAEHALQEHE